MLWPCSEDKCSQHDENVIILWYYSWNRKTDTSERNLKKPETETCHMSWCIRALLSVPFSSVKAEFTQNIEDTELNKQKYLSITFNAAYIDSAPQSSTNHFLLKILIAGFLQSQKMFHKCLFVSTLCGTEHNKILSHTLLIKVWGENSQMSNFNVSTGDNKFITWKWIILLS